MRVIHVISSLQTGGAQRLVSDLAAAQRHLGLAVGVLVYHRLHNHLEQRLTQAGVPLYSLGVRSLRSPGAVMALRRFFRSHPCDVAHAHLFPTLYQLPAALRGMDVAMVYTEHNTTNRRRRHGWLRRVERGVYSCYDAVAACGDEAAKSLAAWVGDGVRGGIRVIPNGIDLTAFSAGQNVARADRRDILMAARFTRAKAQDTLVRALPLVKDKSVRVIFAGEGETLESVKSEAVRRGVAHRCEFLGDCDDVAALMSQALVGVHSSHYEGLPLTPVEMMASGLPVVASDVPGLRGVVSGAGILFADGDAAALAGAIDRLLADAEVYQRCREAGIGRAGGYDINRVAQAYAALYRDV